MKPNFALILAYDGIELCQRAPGGWLSVGSVRFDRPDLDPAIDALIADARRLAPDGVATKLIVPDSEVRYATVLAPGPTDEARRYQIEGEVEGLTPYPIGDLAYDWAVEGDHAQVAIVARETLREAEEFAAERGFNPVSFAARPEGGQFMGEPFFGLAATARAVLKAGDSVQPDAEAVRVTGKAVIPAAGAPAPVAPKPAPQPEARQPETRKPETRQPEARKPEPAPVQRPTQQRRVEIQPAQPATPPKPRPVPPAAEPARPALTVPPAAAEAGRKVSDLVRRMGTRLRREQAESVAQSTSSAATARALPDTEDQVQAAPAEAAVVAFSSRRAAGGGGPPSRAIPAGPPGGRGSRAEAPANPGGRLAILPPDGASGSSFSRLTERGRGAVQSALKSLSMKSRTQGESASAAPARPAAVPDPVDRRPRPVEAPVVGSRPPVDPRDKATEAEALTLFGRRGQVQPQRSLAGPVLMVAGGVVALLAAVAVWALYLGGPAPTQVADAPAPATAPAETAAIVPPAAAPAIQAPAPVDTAPPTETAALPPVEAAPAPVEPAPAQTAAAPESAPETAPVPEAVAEAVVEPDPAPVETDPAILAERLALEALSETPAAEVIERLSPVEPAAPQPEVSAPVEGTAQLAPEPQVAPERPQVAMAAPSGLLSLPGRLVAPPPTDATPPASPAPPPPFDVAAAAAPPAEAQVEAPIEAPVAALGAEPAAEAPPPAFAALPEPEITVSEGQRPSEVPPRAPGRPALELPPDLPREDPALRSTRPEPRSARVRALGEALRAAQPAAGEAPAEAEPDPVQRLDQGSLDQPLVQVAAAIAPPAAPLLAAEPAPDDLAEAPPPGGVSLSALRPLRRPTDLVPDPSQAPPSVEEPAEVVASSLMPAQRPSAFAARVEATLAAQARERERAQQAEDARRARVAAAAASAATPAPQQQTAARRPAPGDEEGEEAASAGPVTPTTASVQESATQRRAIRPREVNLIGVFGAPSNRRALVRMSNGQVVRLQVGDRFDGGQVSAIGDAELRYVRGGQDRVLRIASRG